MSRLEARICAVPDAIAGLMDNIGGFLAREGVEPRAVHHMLLVVEELVTNLGTHADAGDSPVAVAIAVAPAEVTGEIVDRRPPFDPAGSPAPDTVSGVEDRRIGGLGMHLVRELSSRLGYEERDGANHTTFAVARR